MPRDARKLGYLELRGMLAIYIIIRFSLWLQYQAPSSEVIVTVWALFSVGMGTFCWSAAKLRESLEDAPSDREPNG